MWDGESQWLVARSCALLKAAAILPYVMGSDHNAEQYHARLIDVRTAVSDSIRTVHTLLREKSARGSARTAAPARSLTSMTA